MCVYAGNCSLTATSCILYPFVEEADDPACIPVFWISKWVDYSDKYGLGNYLYETNRLFTW